MVIALGIAFRNRDVDQITVAVQKGTPDFVLDSLEQDDRFQVSSLDENECQLQLRTGRTDLIVAPATDGDAQLQYHFDPTKASSVLARNATDDVLQRAAGRTDGLLGLDQRVLHRRIGVQRLPH